MPDERIERVLDGRAWSEFCDTLKAAAEAVLRDASPGSASLTGRSYFSRGGRVTGARGASAVPKKISVR